VTVTVVEYSKRRFTILGQVQKPGSYEFPNEESVELLQAIAMGGGFTRLANPGRVTVTRSIAGQKINYNLDARAMAKDAETKAFEVLPDDVITVAERIF
jgi:polysaccharide export outer membrane protein